MMGSPLSHPRVHCLNRDFTGFEVTRASIQGPSRVCSTGHAVVWSRAGLSRTHFFLGPRESKLHPSSATPSVTPRAWRSPMKDWALVDKATVPGDSIVIRLFQRQQQFSIRVGSRELMTSGEHDSEDALAELGCKHLAGSEAPSVLIGGLGLGYTLAAALRTLGPGAGLVVAELVPAVIDWNRGPLAHLAGQPLEDPRVEVQQADVSRILRDTHAGYDAILLDVDNGPEALTHEDNDWIYSPAGLEEAWSALKPGGVLSVWSAWPDRSFNKRLALAGFLFEEVKVRSESDGEGIQHNVWLALKPADSPTAEMLASR